MLHVNKKSLAKKVIFAQTPFSHSTFELVSKNYKPQNHFRFRYDQNNHFNLNSKDMNMFEQVLKNQQRPNTIQFLWIVERTGEGH